MGEKKMIDLIRIVRYSETEDGTFGVMEYNGQPFCMTLEPNDRGNGRNSCIPAGRYQVHRHHGLKYKNTWAVMDVPNRSAVLFHIGNIENDTVGCILLGKSLGTVKRKMAVVTSSRTFEAFMKLSKQSEGLILTIVEAF